MTSSTEPVFWPGNFASEAIDGENSRCRGRQRQSSGRWISWQEAGCAMLPVGTLKADGKDETKRVFARTRTQSGQNWYNLEGITLFSGLPSNKLISPPCDSRGLHRPPTVPSSSSSAASSCFSHRPRCRRTDEPHIQLARRQVSVNTPFTAHAASRLNFSSSPIVSLNAHHGPVQG